MNLYNYFFLSSPNIYFISMSILPFSLISAGLTLAKSKTDSFFGSYAFGYSFFYLLYSAFSCTFCSSTTLDSVGFIKREFLTQLKTCYFYFLKDFLILSNARSSSGSKSYVPFSLRTFRICLTFKSGFCLTTYSNYFSSLLKYSASFLIFIWFQCSELAFQQLPLDSMLFSFLY